MTTIWVVASIGNLLMESEFITKILAKEESMSDAEFEVYYRKCKKQMLIAILTSPLWLWNIPVCLLKDLIHGKEDDEVLAKGRKERLFFAILTSPLWLWTIPARMLIDYATGCYWDIGLLA